MNFITIPSPCGSLTVWEHENALIRLTFEAMDGGTDTPLLRAAREELSAYFAGALRRFSLPLRPEGTPFQRAVWETLLTVPYGETLTYGGLARRMGRPAAVRPAASACGRNPLPILIPCHRILPADGSLGGYSAGKQRKQILLRLENTYA